MSNAYYLITGNLNVPGYYNLKITVKQDDAISVFDEGEIIILCITKIRCQEEIDGMISLGYNMVSELRSELRFLLGD